MIIFMNDEKESFGGEDDEERRAERAEGAGAGTAGQWHAHACLLVVIDHSVCHWQ